MVIKTAVSAAKPPQLDLQAVTGMGGHSQLLCLHLGLPQALEGSHFLLSFSSFCSRETTVVLMCLQGCRLDRRMLTCCLQLGCLLSPVCHLLPLAGTLHSSLDQDYSQTPVLRLLPLGALPVGLKSTSHLFPSRKRLTVKEFNSEHFPLLPAFCVCPEGSNRQKCGSIVGFLTVPNPPSWGFGLKIARPTANARETPSSTTEILDTEIFLYTLVQKY